MKKFTYRCNLSNWELLIHPIIYYKHMFKNKTFLSQLKRFQWRLIIQFSSVTLWPHGLPHTRPPCPLPTPRVYPNSCPSSRWCHLTISSSVIPFSSCLQPFPTSGSFQMSQLFAWGGQNIGVSASTSVLPKNTQDWSPLGWTVWTSLQSSKIIFYDLEA